MSPSEWRTFLVQLSLDIIADEDAADGLPAGVAASGWLGFGPADEASIAEAEARLGRRLPPSLRSFYAVTNGWRVVGCFIWDVLPVEGLGWIRERDPGLYRLAEMAEGTSGPFKNDPDHLRLEEYRHEQGVRVKRSLVLNSRGDSSTWLLDPGAGDADGEWAGGRWSSWNPAMIWNASDFGELMRKEHTSFLDLTA